VFFDLNRILWLNSKLNSHRHRRYAGSTVNDAPDRCRHGPGTGEYTVDQRIEISDDMRTDLEARIGVSVKGVITKSLILMAEDPIVLAIVINAPTAPDQKLVQQLAGIASKHLQRPVRVPELRSPRSTL
jgi:hypothetical protein